MALESPLLHSPGAGLRSSFSPYTDSPSSPALPRSPNFPIVTADAPERRQSEPAPHPSHTSPTFLDPPDSSPVTSNGTGIEHDKNEEESRESSPPDDPGSAGSVHSGVTVKTIDTAIPLRPRSDSDETPQSVIHAPRGFKTLEPEAVTESRKTTPPPLKDRKTPSPSQRTDFSPESKPSTLQVQNVPTFKTSSSSPVSPPPISTSVGSARFPIDGRTPRAQTRQEAEEVEEEADKSGMEGARSTEAEVPEGQMSEEETFTEDESGGKTLGTLPDLEEEIKALKMALDECWTLCNTLAGLSSIHRERIFNFAGTGDVQQQAWKSCWKLCQKLYDSRDDDQDSQVRPTLDLCRDFCQSLFEVRQRDGEIADSVLRVSFELNNHLYNTHDRNLPEAFRERTLDFYITLCHRLMKQRSGLAEETDSLLRACWSLAEMLFSLRQNKREGKAADEELLGSAVQSCWELCDLFREGWTQVRPDRGTPRPSQTTFSQTFNQMRHNQQQQAHQHPQHQSDLETVHERHHTEPETPTTIFEDMAISPDDGEGPAPPNILVLGTADSLNHHRGGAGTQQRWSSNASTLSGYSQSSAETSSTATTTALPHAGITSLAATSAGTNPAEDAHLLCLKILIIKAALNIGFHPTSTGQTLNTFVKSLPPSAFGNLQWQMGLLQEYKKMILTDPAFRQPVSEMLIGAGNVGPPGGGKGGIGRIEASAPDVARAVLWMVRSGQYGWLMELFKLVFGFRVEEAERMGAVVVTT